MVAGTSPGELKMLKLKEAKLRAKEEEPEGSNGEAFIEVG